MSYVVLARKYRPQTFREVYSQEHITQILSNAIKSSRIAHAYLFTGPRGVGKTSMARILAKSLNCIEGPTDNPCGICHNCLEITSGTSTDVIEIDGASNTGVDDVRELQKELMYAPSNAKFKIYIIDEVHMLSKNAFNAFLKTLEEPPENVIFVFATTEPQKVLPTIISRCQRFDFRRITVDDIVANLTSIAKSENLDIDEESVYLIARKSDGGMRDALSLMDQVISFSDGPIRIGLVREVFSELPLVMHSDIMQAILDHDAHKLILSFHEIVNQGVDTVEFLNSYLEFVRQLVLLKIGITPKGLVRDDLDLLKVLVDKISSNSLLYIMSMLIKLKQDIRTSSHPSILIEVTLLKLTKMEEMEELNQIISKLEQAPSQLSVQTPTTIKPQPRDVPAQPVAKKENQEATIELEYTPPPKVNELTKEHVLSNWDNFIKKIKPAKKVVALYLKKEYITSVSSDVIFMDFDSSMQYRMVSDARESLSDLLSSFFELPVKLITRLNEAVQIKEKKAPTLQDISTTSPMLAKLVELTDAMIVPEGEGRRNNE